jgi:poly(3-hydroxybutyrate) depolymerase
MIPRYSLCHCRSTTAVWPRALLAAAVLALAAGCGSPQADPGGAAPADASMIAPADASMIAPDLVVSIGPSGRVDRAPSIDGVDRTYFLYVPDSAVAAMASGPVPLVIALHGAGSDGDFFFNTYGVGSLADAHAFVMALPSAYNTVWFTQASEGWSRLDGQSSSMRNDVHLIQAIIDDARTSYRIDPRRIYVCGVSRGGAMTGMLAVASNNPNVLGGDYASPFAAYAISAGYNPAPTVDLKASSPPRPVWFIHGDMDNSVPYANGKSFADSLQAVGWPVTFTTVAGAGHAWLWQPKYGHPNEELWTYFSAHPLP